MPVVSREPVGRLRVHYEILQTSRKSSNSLVHLPSSIRVWKVWRWQQRRSCLIKLQIVETPFWILRCLFEFSYVCVSSSFSGFWNTLSVPSVDFVLFIHSPADLHNHLLLNILLELVCRALPCPWVHYSFLNLQLCLEYTNLPKPYEFTLVTLVFKLWRD